MSPNSSLNLAWLAWSKIIDSHQIVIRWLKLSGVVIYPIRTPTIRQIIMHDKPPLSLLNTTYSILILSIACHTFKHKVVLLIKLVHLSSLVWSGQVDVSQVVLLYRSELISVLWPRHWALVEVHRVSGVIHIRSIHAVFEALLVRLGIVSIDAADYAGARETSVG